MRQFPAQLNDCQRDARSDGDFHAAGQGIQSQEKDRGGEIEQQCAACNGQVFHDVKP